MPAVFLSGREPFDVWSGGCFTTTKHETRALAVWVWQERFIADSSEVSAACFPTV